MPAHEFSLIANAICTGARPDGATLLDKGIEGGARRGGLVPVTLPCRVIRADPVFLRGALNSEFDVHPGEEAQAEEREKVR
ncbi:MAG TPA: hypothetical protein DDZ83_15490 [Nitrospinae bacterium]|nr:hypothetical protein [Nitrospinota bacterium]